jgi:hypothetical protein
MMKGYGLSMKLLGYPTMRPHKLIIALALREQYLIWCMTLRRSAMLEDISVKHLH